MSSIMMYSEERRRELLGAERIALHGKPAVIDQNTQNIVDIIAQGEPFVSDNGSIVGPESVQFLFANDEAAASGKIFVGCS